MSYHQVRVGLPLDEGDFNRIFEYFFSNFIFDIRREMGLALCEADCAGDLLRASSKKEMPSLSAEAYGPRFAWACSITLLRSSTVSLSASCVPAA